MKLRKPNRNYRPRSYGFETMEKRLTMAGNVSGKVNGGILNLIGDDLSNSLCITSVGTNKVLVTATNGTKLNGVVNGSYCFDKVSVSVIADMKKGDDCVDVKYFSIAQDLIINGNQGCDTVNVSDAYIGDDLLIYTHEDNDKVNVGGLKQIYYPDTESVESLEPEYDYSCKSVIVKDTFELNTGSGNDCIEVCSFDVNNVFLIRTGTGNDDANIGYCQRYTQPEGAVESLESSSSYLTGANFKQEVASTSNRVGGNFDFASDTGCDEAKIAYICAGGDFKVDMGADADYLDICFSSANKNSFVFGGSGCDSISIAFFYTTLNSLIDTGADADRLSAFQICTKGNANIFSGSGNDCVELCTLDIAKKLTIDAGSDNDKVSLVYSCMNELLLLTGHGNDDVYVKKTKVKGNARFDGGSQTDCLVLDCNSFGSTSNVGFEKVIVNPV